MALLAVEWHLFRCTPMDGLSSGSPVRARSNAHFSKEAASKGSLEVPSSSWTDGEARKHRPVMGRRLRRQDHEETLAPTPKAKGRPPFFSVALIPAPERGRRPAFEGDCAFSAKHYYDRPERRRTAGSVLPISARRPSKPENPPDLLSGGRSLPSHWPVRAAALR